MTNPYASNAVTPLAPPTKAAAVTPSDSTDLTTTAKSLYIGTTGDVKVTLAGGSVVTFSAHPVGYLLAEVARVWSTGTTASNILALFD